MGASDKIPLANQVESSAQSAQEKQMVCVEALADEHDYWLSLTDAARVTRTSEAMVRRWVSSGRLPTKQEPVGINQRTRLVRASDVARLRPIVDPTAAITDQLHKLDLLSIPRQQLHLAQEQGRLLTMAQDVQQMVHQLLEEMLATREHVSLRLQQQQTRWEEQREAFQKAVQHQHEALVHQAHEQDRQSVQRDQELHAHVAQQASDLQQLSHTWREQVDGLQRELERLAQEQKSSLTHLQQEWILRFQQQETQLRQMTQQLAETRSSQEQQHLQTQNQLSALQQALVTCQQELTALLEQREHAMTRFFEQSLAGVQQEQAMLNERCMSLEALQIQWEQQQEQAARHEETRRHHDMEQARRMQELEHQVHHLDLLLQQEKEARSKLEARLSLDESEQTEKRGREHVERRGPR